RQTVGQDQWSGPRDPAEYLTVLIYKGTIAKTLMRNAISCHLKNEYFERVITMRKSVQELVSNPDQNDFRKTPVDFSKLFRPGRLLNALRQVTAKGILLQGALFDGQLRDTVVSTPPVTTAPQLTLGWTKIGSPTQYKESESVAVPLYTDVTRSEYIATVAMPFDVTTVEDPSERGDPFAYLKGGRRENCGS
ncbi:hypothetical protein OSTOST_21052, partial [Ostertagia ostertagi]